MTTTRPELIIERLVTIFQGITTGAGYQTTVTEVARHSRAIEQIQPSRMPFIGILEDGQEVPTAQPGYYQMEYEVPVLGYVQADTETNAATAIANLESDIRRAAFSDPTLGDDPNDASQKVVITLRLKGQRRLHFPDKTQAGTEVVLSALYLQSITGV